MGMSEVWYTGPIAQKAGGEFGADLGFEVSMVVLTCYPRTESHCLNSSPPHFRPSRIRHYAGSRSVSLDGRELQLYYSATPVQFFGSYV